MKIELKNITVFSGDYPVLENVSLALPPHQFIAIIGPSGCGKSTLLKVIAGLIIPDRGKVFYQNKDFYHLSEKEYLSIKKINGFVFQDSALWANKSIYENLALPLSFHFPELKQDKIKERVFQTLTEINLLDSVYLRPAQLSGGEQKIVSFMRALITDPKLIFLDEPTSLIDRPMRRQILLRLHKEKQNAKTIICVTHDNGLISQLVDYLVVLDTGQLLQAGPKNEIFLTTVPKVKKILEEITASSAKEFQNWVILLLKFNVDNNKPNWLE